MFQSPFSYEGRIRRLEYGLSYLIYTVISVAISLLMEQNSDAYLLRIIFYIPMIVFLTAQGSKRCHDLGNKGWFQLIPFYVLWMIFQDGQIGENSFGLNPKGIGNEESFDEQINEIGKSLEP